ncbi:hypothetical protein SAMN05421841_2685 [Chryseobacterium wanjuense]|uniref:Uncharacterized protein n=1 Tax=Chryseobacterium wanjuense TaxID=356305 RepID=A0A1I0RH96_9FLAO|nr:hypothetical protein [Chryseobacterium wanjuense]SEW40258.1 hypothetical protein SAMN05421841_2685 [Chryseobacterium wanjuense]
MKTLYKSNRKFRIWAYMVSHSSLILRSEMKYPDQDDYAESISSNIDIEFWAVSYINLPSDLLGINIREITSEALPKEINKDLLIFDMRIFELKSDESKYYVIAGGILIGENKWINQDRIFNYDSNLKHDKILFQS